MLMNAIFPGLMATIRLTLPCGGAAFSINNRLGGEGRLIGLTALIFSSQAWRHEVSPAVTVSCSWRIWQKNVEHVDLRYDKRGQRSKIHSRFMQGSYHVGLQHDRRCLRGGGILQTVH